MVRLGGNSLDRRFAVLILRTLFQVRVGPGSLKEVATEISIATIYGFAVVLTGFFT